jgi:phosphoribosylformylglycinamidine cyclo-ligase
VLPKDCDVVIAKSSWDVPPIFELLRAKGRVPEAELYQVFNMGIGMVLIVAPNRADAVLRSIHRHGHPAWRIGNVERGTGKAHLR